MSRTKNKRFFKDQWRFSKFDPNQFKLPLGEEPNVFLGENGDDVRVFLANWARYTKQHSSAYERATIAKLEILQADNSVNEPEVEQALKFQFDALKRLLRDHNRMHHAGSFVAQKFAEENTPPNRAEMLLLFGLPKRDREYMIGDLEEEYRTVILPKYGPRVAARWYWWQAVRSVVAASGGRVRVWLSFGGLARAAGWIVEKFTL